MYNNIAIFQINDLTHLSDYSTALSLYWTTTTEVNQVYTVEDLYNYVTPSYELGSIIGLIPVGCKVSGQDGLYYAIYDGTYLRCNAPINSAVFFYFIHFANATL